MTPQTFCRSFVVVLILSAVAFGFPRAAQAQAAAQVSMAAQGETPAADAVKTDSGLVYKITAPGRGSVHPTVNDLVKVVTLFWTKESVESKPSSMSTPTQPILMGAIIAPGLREALALMTTGQRMRLWLPEKLAFAGAAGKPKGPLMVDVMLLDIIAPPATPSDVAAAPADAQKTKTGLAYKILKPGTGTVHPKSNSTVTVHYTGWTTDGKIIDSSVIKGQPLNISLDGEVIKGWSEGLRLMVVGESRRFWIPGRLAYDGSDLKDVPRGMLVFDIELIAIDGK